MHYYERGRRLPTHQRSDKVASVFRKSPNALPDSFGKPP